MDLTRWLIQVQYVGGVCFFAASRLGVRPEYDPVLKFWTSTNLNLGSRSFSNPNMRSWLDQYCLHHPYIKINFIFRVLVILRIYMSAFFR